MSDTFGASRKFRILAINNDCCRENLCLVGDTSISGERVARELDTLARLYGKPTCIVSDNPVLSLPKGGRIYQSGDPQVGQRQQG